MKKKISCNKCYSINYYNESVTLTIKCDNCWWYLWKNKKAPWKEDNISKILINTDIYSKSELTGMNKEEIDTIIEELKL